MAKRVQRYGVSSGVMSTLVGFAREFIVNTTRNSIHVHDGVTAGGYEVMRADAANGALATLSTPGLVPGGGLPLSLGGTGGTSKLTARAGIDTDMQNGQCYLSLSGGNLLLSPRNGNNIIVNGTQQKIPASGVSKTPAAAGVAAPISITSYSLASNGTVTVNTATNHNFQTGQLVWVSELHQQSYEQISGTFVITVTSPTQFTYSTGFTPPAAVSTIAATAGSTCGLIYYVYTFVNAGALDLECVNTGYTFDATYGHPVKSADPSRTLVGMCRTIAGPAFADSGSQRFVLSWYNRKHKTSRAYLPTSSANFSNTYDFELSTALRAEFLCWGDDEIIRGGNGRAVTTISDTLEWNWRIDCSMNDDGAANCEYAGTGQNLPLGATETAPGLAEGYHFVTLVFNNSNTTAVNFIGGASPFAAGSQTQIFRTRSYAQVQG